MGDLFHAKRYKMIEANCPKCSSHYYGWALRFPRNQYCSKCGAALDILEDNQTTHGYSPFDAEKYIFSDQSEERIVPDQISKPEVN